MSKPAPSLSRPQRLYRLLVRLYPRHFRSVYEHDMIIVFDDLYRDIAHLPPPQYYRHLTRLYADTSIQIVREALSNWRNYLMGIDPTSPAPQKPSARRITILNITAAVFLGLCLLAYPTVRGLWSEARYNLDIYRQAKHLAGNWNSGHVAVLNNFITD